MTYQLRFTPAVNKQIKKLDLPAALRIKGHLSRLDLENPQSAGKPLAGDDASGGIELATIGYWQVFPTARSWSSLFTLATAATSIDRKRRSPKNIWFTAQEM